MWKIFVEHFKFNYLVTQPFACFQAKKLQMSPTIFSLCIPVYFPEVCVLRTQIHRIYVEYNHKMNYEQARYHNFRKLYNLLLFFFVFILFITISEWIIYILHTIEQYFWYNHICHLNFALIDYKNRTEKYDTVRRSRVRGIRGVENIFDDDNFYLRSSISYAKRRRRLNSYSREGSFK